MSKMAIMKLVRPFFEAKFLNISRKNCKKWLGNAYFTLRPMEVTWVARNGQKRPKDSQLEIFKVFSPFFSLSGPVFSRI